MRCWAFFDFPASTGALTNDEPIEAPWRPCAARSIERLPVEQDALAMVFKLSRARRKLAPHSTP